MIYTGTADSVVSPSTGSVVFAGGIGVIKTVHVGSIISDGGLTVGSNSLFVGSATVQGTMVVNTLQATNFSAQNGFTSGVGAILQGGFTSNSSSRIVGSLTQTGGALISQQGTIVGNLNVLGTIGGTAVNTGLLNVTGASVLGGGFTSNASSYISSNLLVNGTMSINPNSLIDFGSGGNAPPSTSGGWSSGTKINLLGGTDSNHYAIGIESGNMWFSGNGGFKFYTGMSSTPTTTMSIATGGNVIVAAGMTVGSNAYVGGLLTAWGGITFNPGTNPTNSATSTGNTMQEYEVGNWTPFYQGGSVNPTLTYNLQYGRYIRIGELVHFIGRLSAGAVTGTGSGSLYIAGFPYVSANLNLNLQAVGSIGYRQNWTGLWPTRFPIYINSTRAELQGEASPTSGSTPLTGANLLAAGGSDLIFSGTYFTTA